MASTGECDKRFEQSMTKDTDPSDGVDYHAQSIALPRSNTEYGKKTYWDERFATESEYEWLASWEEVAYLLKPFLSPSSRILVVGCGNSSFSADLYDAGYTDICSLDYSEIVIDAVKTRNETIRPEMTWMVMDMTDLSCLEDESFDVVIDKAAMDALMTQEGDVWNPNQKVIDQSRSMCSHVTRILNEGGNHLQISFAQPHFRKKYLLGWHQKQDEKQLQQTDDSYSDEFGWSLRVETIGGDSNNGCFHHFLYIMTKQKRDR